ncbi:MFS transporter [Sphingomonas glacialis]|uniref:MFS transporter n=1 Tax=Sphingomonas glacialis TaxID=658225 RepID=A0A502FRG7_9SPHN|nr:MFS transporter [Sphingomonas glacialis]TPG52055.1 MFS transporter [Sphingomonas glacialis]
MPEDLSAAVSAARTSDRTDKRPSEVRGGAQSKRLLLLCVSVPSFMINLDGNIVAVSLPSIGRALHADFAAIEWVISAYTLTFAALVMPAGALADRYGRKRILVVGLAVFTLASFLCGAAPTAVILNAARAMQGVGAALLLSAALALLSKEFQGAERAPAFAFWGSVIGIAITLGPLVGGVLTQTLGWEWAFYVNVPVGIVMIALSVRAVPESRDPDSAKVDVAGAGSFAAALFLLTFALISGNHRGWSDPLVVATLSVSVILFIVFGLVETHQARPMLDLSFFRLPTYVGANLAGLTYAAALLTMLTYIPLYFQGGMNVSPTTAGLMMVPMALPLFIVPRLVARYLTHWMTGRALLALGLTFVSIGLFALSALASAFAPGPMLIAMAIAGIGAGILNGETAKVGLSVIPPARAGMAAGVGGTVRFAGIVLGFAGLGAILFERISAFLDAAPIGPRGRDLSSASTFIASGDLSAAARLPGTSVALAHAGFAAGYQTLFAVAAVIALAGAMSSLWLIEAVAPSRRGTESDEIIPEFE